MTNFETILANGGAVIMPTETVYGLFAKALDEQAVEFVYRLKKRPKDKAMNLNVSSLEEIYRFSKHQPAFLEDLYQAFLPGPLTIILEANELVPNWINSGLKTVGFRVPNHAETQKLIRSQGPLIGPSANLSGTDSGRLFDEIVQAFEGQVTGFRDDQALLGVDSTILDLSSDKARILRQGSITQADICRAIPEIQFQ
ncbi:L-threonylcarbamoyladenylate synthase [Streptococcus saliviloxodontae]|uniref:L-threonylcarbamoyladenylate synthase n=1 Tax=Streptococcus saliviloxodontae TaxID=1349416 RepID=A0ABS2PL10_9STRE|nr:L-threonylcarbamoyladenylate synthase [Streptococcus saliviloxodontae]MBM7636129.1 L-threonylcarbamoyladenylate synthase [Streptococcus saliviloxodontae]